MKTLDHHMKEGVSSTSLYQGFGLYYLRHFDIRRPRWRTRIYTNRAKARTAFLDAIKRNP